MTATGPPMRVPRALHRCPREREHTRVRSSEDIIRLDCPHLPKNITPNANRGGGNGSGGRWFIHLKGQLLWDVQVKTGTSDTWSWRTGTECIMEILTRPGTWLQGPTTIVVRLRSSGAESTPTPRCTGVAPPLGAIPLTRHSAMIDYGPGKKLCRCKWSQKYEFNQWGNLDWKYLVQMNKNPSNDMHQTGKSGITPKKTPARSEKVIIWKLNVRSIGNRRPLRMGLTTKAFWFVVRLSAPISPPPSSWPPLIDPLGSVSGS